MNHVYRQQLIDNIASCYLNSILTSFWRVYPRSDHKFQFHKIKIIIYVTYIYVRTRVHVQLLSPCSKYIFIHVTSFDQIVLFLLILGYKQNYQNVTSYKDIEFLKLQLILLYKKNVAHLAQTHKLSTQCLSCSRQFQFVIAKQSSLVTHSVTRPNLHSKYKV